MRSRFRMAVHDRHIDATVKKRARRAEPGHAGTYDGDVGQVWIRGRDVVNVSFTGASPGLGGVPMRE